MISAPSAATLILKNRTFLEICMGSVFDFSCVNYLWMQCNCSRARLIDHQLKVNRSNSILTIVSNVLGPGLALDVDDDATHWTLEVHRHQGTQVSFRVLVWEIVAGESLLWEVSNWSDILNISWILALARDPHRVQLYRENQWKIFLMKISISNAVQTHLNWISNVSILYELFQTVRHFPGQILRIIEISGYPSVDFVEFEENAW